MAKSYEEDEWAQIKFLPNMSLVVLQQGFLFYYLEESRWDMMNLIEKRM